MANVTFVTYPNASNITSFSGGYDYGQSVMLAGTGYNAFAPLVLLGFFLVFLAVGAKYTQERAFVFSTFMTTIVAFIMVSGAFLDPNWMVLVMIVFLISLFSLSSK